MPPHRYHLKSITGGSYFFYLTRTSPPSLPFRFLFRRVFFFSGAAHPTTPNAGQRRRAAAAPLPTNYNYCHSASAAMPYPPCACSARPR